MAADPIVGAWELVSDSRVAIAIFTGSHYAFVGAPKDRRPSAGNQATPDTRGLECMPCLGWYLHGVWIQNHPD